MEWVLALVLLVVLVYSVPSSLAQVDEPSRFQVTRLDTNEQASREHLLDIFDDNLEGADSRHPWTLFYGDDSPVQISLVRYDVDQKKVLDESILLPYANLSILLRCEGTAPVEWVHDDDRGPGSPQRRSEFTRRSPRPGNETFDALCHFVADLYLFYREFEGHAQFLCRAVTNHSNNIALELALSSTLVNGSYFVNVTTERGSDLHFPGRETPADDSGCPAHLVVVHTTAGFYWRCTLESGEPAKVSIHVCDTAPYCANTFRAFRVPQKCVTFDQSVRLPEVSKSRHWWPMLGNVRAGVAVCGRSPEAAVEFFVYQNGSQKKVSIGFHLTPELVRAGLIWLDPPPTGEVYYTREVFTTRCHVSKYGLAGYAQLHVTLDGNRTLEIDGSIRGSRSGATNLNSFISKPVTLRFQEHGPAHVLISCAAPVWNTTEVINRTWAFEFRDEIQPFFEVPQQNLTFTDGDVDRTLVCDAQGDPPPDARLTWEHRNPPGVRVKGRELILGRVYAEWSDGETISCTATNKFGDSATKTFSLRVEPRRPGHEEGGGTGVPTVALIVGGVCLAAALLGGLALFLYCRFVRVRVGERNSAHILSQQELKEFREGATSKARTEGGVLIDARGRFVPYDQKYEIPRENLYVDFGAKLGSGHYGVVFKGYFKRTHPNSNSTPEQVHVAVKVVPAHVPVEYFKALLSELKILVHIGEHERVANLLGACTANIQQGELYVCVELCKTSLLHWLRTAPSTLRRYVQADFAGARAGAGLLDPCAHKYTNEDMSLEDLFRWTAQIASGMEFLSEKRIVHADLAARNVLLTFKHSAKICDFGLARQLVGYKYIQSSSAALPWQWMAIETLRQREFTVKSDVWSFGVTCWEVFTLGDVPYPCTSFTFDFVDQLQAGRRLPKPKHATNATYGLMLECWNPKKEDRPTFAALAAFLEAQAKKEDKRVTYVNTQF